jgi:tetratricopeptide (TPR) repeat protein
MDMKIGLSLICIFFLAICVTSCAKNPALEHASNGDVFMEQGNYDQAISEYSQAIELDPKYPEIKNKLAVAYSDRGKSFVDEKEWDSAIADTNKAIELDPQLANAYNIRGSAYIEKGSEDEMSAFDHKYNEESALATEFFNKAIDNFTLAIDDKKMALKLNPTHELYKQNLAIAYNERGKVYNEKEGWDLAISDFTAALELEPDMKEAYNNRGYAYNGKGFSDKAIADLDKAIELDPNVALYYSNRSWSYYQKEEYDQAIIDGTSAIKLDPNLAVAYMNRGNSYFQKGMMTKAAEDFNKVLDLTRDPELIAAANKVLLIIQSK